MGDDGPEGDDGPKGPEGGEDGSSKLCCCSVVCDWVNADEIFSLSFTSPFERKVDIVLIINLYN